MYFKITDNCSILCPVCGRLCASQSPDFDSQDKFEKELYINIYNIRLDHGSENSRFWSKLIETIISTSEQYLEWMANHSKQKYSELKLAPFSCKRGLIDCELSLDDWCEPINPRVAKSFTLLAENDLFYPKINAVTMTSKIVRKTSPGEYNTCLCGTNSILQPSILFDMVVKTGMATKASDPVFSRLYRVDMKFKKQDSAGLATPLYLSVFDSAWFVQIQP